MILIGVLSAITTTVFDLLSFLPTWTAPAAVQHGGSIESGMTTFGGYASNLSAWIDFTQVAAIITVIEGALVVAAAIWIVRKALNMIPYVNV